MSKKKLSLEVKEWAERCIEFFDIPEDELRVIRKFINQLVQFIDAEMMNTETEE